MTIEHRPLGDAPSVVTNHSSENTGSTENIPIPRSHNIRHTRSDIQLAEETLRAEQDDKRMFARIMAGLQLQYSEHRGILHPLSRKSLQGIVRTAQASHEELVQRDSSHNDDREVSSIEDQNANDTLSQGSMKTHDVTISSRGSIEEDDWVFSFEL